MEESDPKYSPGCWLGGWADCRPQQGPKGIMCTTLSSHNTDRGTGEDPKTQLEHSGCTGRSLLAVVGGESCWPISDHEA